MASMKENIQKIIDLHDGIISIENIIDYYMEEFYVNLDAIQLNNIKKYFLEHFSEYSFDETVGTFYLKANHKYLYKSDNKQFSSIVEVLNSIFGFHRNPKGAWEASYPAPDNNIIFFARKKSKSKWTNAFSSNDEKFEMHPPVMPATIINEPLEDKLFYIFSDINNKGVYEFRGVFKQVAKNNNGSEYKMIDDKVQIFKPTFNDFEAYLTYQVDNNILKPGSKQTYLSCVDSLNEYLKNNGYTYTIDKNISISDLKDLYKEVLDKSKNIGQINKSRNNSWSATLYHYIQYKS